jgi:hypothetical protein
MSVGCPSQQEVPAHLNPHEAQDAEEYENMSGGTVPATLAWQIASVFRADTWNLGPKSSNFMA